MGIRSCKHLYRLSLLGIYKIEISSPVNLLTNLKGIPTGQLYDQSPRSEVPHLYLSLLCTNKDVPSADFVLPWSK